MALCGRFDDMGNAHPERNYKLGIFGGTFDPVHTGHLAAAECVREAVGLDAVVFMPAGVPVFKRQQKVSSGEDRLEMCRRATAENPAFDVSDLEVRRKGDTYTYETMYQLRSHFPENVELYFIAGADAILTLGKWRNAGGLIQLARFVGMTRPGYLFTREQHAVRVDGRRIEVDFVEVPGLSISSSYLRDCVERGRTIRYLVPDAVREYIEERGLYRNV